MKAALKSHQNLSITVYQCPGGKNIGGESLLFSNILFAFPGLLSETEKQIEKHSYLSITAVDTNQFLSSSLLQVGSLEILIHYSQSHINRE